LSIKKPTVSVLIPTYNRAEMVIEAIQSVLHQTYTDYEIIVVDDGSTDNTRERIAALASDKVRYFYQENQGRPAARNHTLRRVQGKYIAFLDSDDLWLPHKLEKQVKYLESNPMVGMVCTTYERVLMDGTIISRHPPQLKEDVHHQFLRACNIQTSTIMLRHDVITDIGEFDLFLLNTQDVDYWLRVAHEFTVGEITETLVKMRLREKENLTRDPEKVLKYLPYVLWKNSKDYGWLFRRRLITPTYVLYGSALLDRRPTNLGLAWKTFFKGLLTWPFSPGLPLFAARLIARTFLPQRIQNYIKAKIRGTQS
jgi:glycosyltransferase involved in cell wall biosynthesis